ncbi:MAG: uroporphyrinogen-III synthase [Pseudomonadota bacterium]
MKVLVTRPLQQANKTAERLWAAGYEPVVHPLLSVVMLKTPQPTGDLVGDLVADWGGLIVTSANAVPSLMASDRLSSLKFLPVLATGSVTALALKEAGFGDVDHVDGSALDIAERLADWTSNKGIDDKPVLYASAAAVAHDLTALGREQGVAVVSWPVYETRAALRFEDDVKALLLNGEIAAVLLYSPRTAACFSELYRHLHVEMAAQRTLRPPICLVLSEAVRAALSTDLQKVSRVARKPTEAALFEILP